MPALFRQMAPKAWGTTLIVSEVGMMPRDRGMVYLDHVIGVAPDGNDRPRELMGHLTGIGEGNKKLCHKYWNVDSSTI